MRVCHVLVVTVVFWLAPSVSHAQEKIPVRVGYEILQVKSLDEIVAWATMDITREQFDALKLPLGWFKNQPRESEMDRGAFLSSPGQDEGTHIKAEHFGFTWMHVATVRKAGTRLDTRGLLTACTVQKNHRVTFEAGRTITVLVSPKGEVYPRISRDANRTRDVPKLPDTWRLVEYKTDVTVDISLPAKTLVIRADNQDSFQGPVKLDLKEKEKVGQ